MHARLATPLVTLVTVTQVTRDSQVAREKCAFWNLVVAAIISPWRSNQKDISDASLCDWFHLVKASNHYQMVGNPNFPLVTGGCQKAASWSMWLCEVLTGRYIHPKILIMSFFMMQTVKIYPHLCDWCHSSSGFTSVGQFVFLWPP